MYIYISYFYTQIMNYCTFIKYYNNIIKLININNNIIIYYTYLLR